MSIFDRFRNSDAPAAAPKPDPEPRGFSGRGHSNGFLQLEELNPELMGPSGQQIFDAMYRTDGDVRQVIGIVANPIIAGTWDVVPYGGSEATAQDVEIADFVKWALWEALNPNILSHFAEALPVLLRAGFAPFELTWRRTTYKGKDMLVPRQLGLRLPRTIYRWYQNDWGELVEIVQTNFFSAPNQPAVTRYETGGVQVVRGGAGGGIGDTDIHIPADHLLYYRIGAEGDNWEGTSLLRPAYKHWKIKDAIERIDAIAQEREAIGVPIVYPPMGANDDQLQQMESILANMRSNEQGYILMPGPKAGAGATEGQGWLVELLGFDRSGGGRDPQPSLKYHTDKIMASFIAEFMRLGHSTTGSRASSQVQQEPFMLSVEALSGQIEQTVNDGLVDRLVSYNYPGVDNPPRLKMSLVDSSSLSDLSDFILKLVQVGAIIPDARLEEFLRARADLPDQDPGAIKKIGNDQQYRKDVLTGGPGGTAAGGSFGGPESKKPNKAAPQARSATGTPGVGSHEKLGVSHHFDVTLDGTYAYPFDMFELGMNGDGLMRMPDGLECNTDLDSMCYEMDDAPDLMAAACGPAMRQAAINDDYSLDDLAAPVAQRLHAHYASGRSHVAHELGLTIPQTLNASMDYADALSQRANLGALHIANAMQLAAGNADLSHGNPAARVRAAEKAGHAAAREVGRVHGVASLMHGRHDMILDNPDSVYGVRYTAILDKNTCGPCDEADDGQIRALDDPVRLDNRPPNRHCDSTASGHNKCRCYEVPVPMPGALTDDQQLDAADVPDKPGDNNWIDKTGTGDLPPFIGDIAGDLITERGFTTQRAIATAVSRVKAWAANATGKVKADTQAKAQEALSEWESKRGQAHGS